MASHESWVSGPWAHASRETMISDQIFCKAATAYRYGHAPTRHTATFTSRNVKQHEPMTAYETESEQSAVQEGNSQVLVQKKSSSPIVKWGDRFARGLMRLTKTNTK